MKTATAALGSFALLLAACSKGAPAPAAEQAEAKAAAAVAKAAEPAKAAESEAGDEEGCLHGKAHDASCDGTTIPAPGSTGHFGAPFTLAAAKPLSEVLSKDALPEGPVRVEGTVASVCQKKGCWMVLADGEVKARILMKDHAFALPTDARGKHAEVEGTVEKRTLTKAQVEHLAKDEGKDPSKAGGERVEFVITATGVELAPTS